MSWVGLCPGYVISGHKNFVLKVRRLRQPERNGATVAGYDSDGDSRLPEFQQNLRRAWNELRTPTLLNLDLLEPAKGLYPQLVRAFRIRQPRAGGFHNGKDVQTLKAIRIDSKL